MIDQDLTCLTTDDTGALPLYFTRPGDLERFLAEQSEAHRAWLKASDFGAKAGEVALLPGPGGLAGAVLGLGDEQGPHVFGALPSRLPPGTVWRLVAGGPRDAALGFCLGAYRFTGIKPAEKPLAKLVHDPADKVSTTIARAIWMARDLVNTPANHLGPAELADIAGLLARKYGASADVVDGAALDDGYPAIAAVGRGSARPPRVAILRWKGSKADIAAPLVSLCGKGVCFDTGGYDLKPSSAMLRMKKDMGGAAVALAVSRMVMEADLPIRLVTRIGCVENSVSGMAMRPSDVIRTRGGLTVEVGNTDGEGRLVLCDLLADASAEQPALLLDFATLTGAARVALGPDLPALFCDDDDWANRMMAAGTTVSDPVWRLPLWNGYDEWLKSPIADLNNIAAKPFAGAIVAALFLRRFVTKNIPHGHFDLYAWNDQTRPGRPEGGEAQTARAVFHALNQHFGAALTAH